MTPSCPTYPTFLEACSTLFLIGLQIVCMQCVEPFSLLHIVCKLLKYGF